jgi:hypothetical protein
MRTLLVFLVLALSVFAAPRARATDVTLTWTAPTANNDGTTPALVGGYNLYVATSDAQLTTIPNTLHGGHPISVGNVLTATLKAVLPGTYVYAVTAWYCATATNCTESAQSAHVSTTVGSPVTTTPTPGIPGSVKVTVTVSSP